MYTSNESFPTSCKKHSTELTLSLVFLLRGNPESDIESLLSSRGVGSISQYEPWVQWGSIDHSLCRGHTTVYSYHTLTGKSARLQVYIGPKKEQGNISRYSPVSVIRYKPGVLRQFHTHSQSLSSSAKLILVKMSLASTLDTLSPS